jgi:dienelactone hydrolase
MSPLFPRTLLLRVVTAVALVASAAPSRAAVLTTVPATPGSPAVPVYVARPAGAGPFPAVLILHGCGGINGYSVVTADRLALRGYVGVALDSLAPDIYEDECTDRGGSSREAAAARATLAWLRAQPFVARDRLAVIGFSMGGIATLDLVDPKSPAPPPAGLRAAVTYYPQCAGRDGRVTVPLAIFIGDADTVVSPPACTAMANAGKAAGKPIEITVYPGATHGFQVPGPDRDFFGQTLRYDPAAAADAAQKTATFLDTYLAASSAPQR